MVEARAKTFARGYLEQLPAQVLAYTNVWNSSVLVGTPGSSRPIEPSLIVEFFLLKSLFTGYFVIPLLRMTVGKTFALSGLLPLVGSGKRDE